MMTDTSNNTPLAIAENYDEYRERLLLREIIEERIALPSTKHTDCQTGRNLLRQYPPLAPPWERRVVKLRNGVDLVRLSPTGHHMEISWDHGSTWSVFFTAETVLICADLIRRPNVGDELIVHPNEEDTL